MISRIIDKVVQEMNDWAGRSVDQICAAVFADAIVVRVRGWQVANRPVYAAVGVRLDGEEWPRFLGRRHMRRLGFFTSIVRQSERPSGPSSHRDRGAGRDLGWSLTTGLHQPTVPGTTMRAQADLNAVPAVNDGEAVSSDDCNSGGSGRLTARRSDRLIGGLRGQSGACG